MKVGYHKEAGFYFIAVSHLVAVLTVDHCSKDTHYLCSNENCIPRAAVNNSVNDCGDNSDEVPLPCRKPLYSCKGIKCILMDWVLDGKNDCTDGSDEAKIIGTACDEEKHCCPCRDFVANSICLRGKCQCMNGYYSNELGTVCQPRIVGSGCVNDADCIHTIPLSSCVQSRCDCPTGFGPSPDSRSCRKRDLNDVCSTDPDCSFITNGRCHHGYCSCRHGHSSQVFLATTITTLSGEYSEANITFDSPDVTTVCHPNFLNDTCSADDNCLPQNSKCIDGICSCSIGYYISTSRKSASKNNLGKNSTEFQNAAEYCRTRTIGDKCETNEECSAAIEYSFCDVSKRCACTDYEQLDDNGMIYCVHGRSWLSIIIITVCTAVIGCLFLLDLFLIVWICRRYVFRERIRKEDSGRNNKTSCNGHKSPSTSNTAANL